MIAKLFLLFVLAPLVELAILIRLGGWIGFWPTVGMLLATGLLGAALARSQGAQVLTDIRSDLSLGCVPTARLLDGLLILIGGILLLTPGLLSDVAGLVLLFPLTRRRLKEGLRKRIQTRVSTGEVGMITLIS